MSLAFKIEKTNPGQQARIATLTLPSLKEPQGGAAKERLLWQKPRVIETPCFMPVGTQATVKGLQPQEVWQSGSRMMLCNTYHLLSKPGADLLENLGGLHAFMNWPGGIITDSGGFQVYSLAKGKKGAGKGPKIDDQGVTFQHHIDGSTIRLEPENVLDIQRQMGSDIAMVLDECIELPQSRQAIAKATFRTLAWAKRARKHMELWQQKGIQKKPFVFGICQGGLEEDLRRENALSLKELNFDGYALGGFSVGEPLEKTFSLVCKIAPLLPDQKPRYLMGVGTPTDLVHYVQAGMDLFDCVLPTRNARNGQLFTRHGKLAIGNARFREDQRPIDPDCSCPTCQGYSRAYLRHLFMAKEILSSVLNSIHNLYFYQNLFREIRQSIRENRFNDFYHEFLQLQKGDGSV